MLEHKGNPSRLEGKVLLKANSKPSVPTSSVPKQFITTTSARDGWKNLNAASPTRAWDESEDHFRLLFATIMDAIVVFDAQTQQIVEVNDAALRLYGYGREELLQLKVTELSENPEASMASIKRVACFGPQLIPLRYHRKKDGTAFPVEISVNSFVRHGRQLFCGVIRDITERQRIQERLDRFQRLKAILDRVQNAIIHQPRSKRLLMECCRVAVQKGGFKLAWIGMLSRNGAVKSAAQAGATGYLDKYHLEVIGPPSRRDPVVTAIRENRPVVVRDTEQSVVGSAWGRLIRKFGIKSVAAFPLRVGGRIVGSFQFYASNSSFFDRDEINLLAQICTEISFALTTRDTVAKRRQARSELRRSEGELKDFFDNSPMGLLWVGANGQILRINQTLLDLLAQKPETVTGQPVAMFCTLPGDSAELLERLAKGETVQNRHACLRQANGNNLHVLIDANGWWEKRRLVHSRWFVRDITRRVTLEREVLNASERERQRLGQDLHDDLCQQLTGIHFLSQALARNLTKVTGAPVADAEEITRLARNTVSLTRDLAHGLSPLQTDANGLMDGLRALVNQTAKVFRIDCHLECPAPVLIPDQTMSLHLYRIAQEAVGNAVKHGKATRIDIRLTAFDSQVKLVISDDGVGLIENNGQQPGIGLRLMQYRAHLIGGALKLQAGAHGGTEVVCAFRDCLHPLDKEQTS